MRSHYKLIYIDCPVYERTIFTTLFMLLSSLGHFFSRIRSSVPLCCFSDTISLKKNYILTYLQSRHTEVLREKEAKSKKKNRKREWISHVSTFLIYLYFDLDNERKRVLELNTDQNAIIIDPNGNGNK